MEASTAPPSTTPHAPLIDLSVRVRFSVAARLASAMRDRPGTGELPSLLAPDIRRGRVRILGAQMLLGQDVLASPQGGSNSRKFVRAVLEAPNQLGLVQAVVNHFAEAIDARDIGALLRAAAVEHRISVRHISQEIGRGSTWAKELDGLGRISGEASALIDSDDHWPTLENLVHVSRGRDVGDQIARWQNIANGATRAQRRPVPDTAENLVVQLSRKLEALIAVAEKLKRHPDWPCDNITASPNGKIIAHQYDLLGHTLGLASSYPSR